MTTPDQGVVIRSREVWDKLCEVEVAVNELRAEVKTTVKDHGKQLDDLTQRVRSLEEMRWRATGAGAALGAIVSLGVTFLAR